MIFTPHAKKRRKQMHVTEHNVEAVLDRPDMSYPSDRQDNARVYIKDDLCVVARKCNRDPSQWVIITLLWHRAVGRGIDGEPVYTG